MLVVNTITMWDVIQSVISVAIGAYAMYRWIKAPAKEESKNTIENHE